jgi:hypothetical protein
MVADGVYFGALGSMPKEVKTMKYSVSLHSEDGEFIAECADLSLTTRALSPTNALDSMRDEIRYRLELCPCTSVDDDFVELDIKG